jgi:hypothetical protein
MLDQNYKPSFSSALRIAAVGLLLLQLLCLDLPVREAEMKRHREFENSFTPINAASSFTLKKSLYSGSTVVIRPQADNRISMNAMITYQRGNTTLYTSLSVQGEYRSFKQLHAEVKSSVPRVRIQMPK